MNPSGRLGKKEQDWVLSMLPLAEKVVGSKIRFEFDEVFQEACISLCELSLKLDWTVSPSDLQGWAFNAIRNGIKAFFRKKSYGWGWGGQEEKKPKARYTDEEFYMAIKTGPPDWDLKREFNLLWRKLNERVALSLIGYYTLPYNLKGVAESLGFSSGVVDGCLHRGRRILMPVLRKHTSLEGKRK